MPFTPSHAVVALPCVRTPIPAAAVAVGAMTPDLPLFLRGTPVTYGLTHSVENLALTVLVAFGLLMVWYFVLRPAVRELSPKWLAGQLPVEWDAAPSRVAQRLFVPWGRTGLLLAGLVIGVLSHIAWDLFTHEGRWGGQLVPALELTWGPFEGYRWLQYVSSALGLTALGIAGAVWLMRRHAAPLDRATPAIVRAAWWASLPIVLVTAWVAGLSAFGPLDESFGVRHLAYRVLPAAAGAWGIGTLALCVVVGVIARKHARHARDAP